MSRWLVCFLIVFVLIGSLPAVAQNKSEDKPLYRKWKAAAGNFEVEAELQVNERDKVVLKRKDTGKELTLTPDKLSTADRQYLTALAQLEGYWELSTVEMSGAIMPNKPDNTFHFERGKFKVQSKDGNFGQGTMEIDPSKSPKTIDFAGDHPLTGIYAIDGGTLKICGSDGAVRPANFNTKGSKTAILMTLKRVDKPAVPLAAGAPAVGTTPTMPPGPPAAGNSPAEARPPVKPGEPLTAAAYFDIPQSQVDKIIATDRSPKLNIPTEEQKAFQAEVEAAKGPLAAMPQFKAKYDALDAAPTNRGDLAKLLAEYWKAEKIADKSPVQSRAILEEVERLSLGSQEWPAVFWSVQLQQTAKQFPLDASAARKRIIASLTAPAIRMEQGITSQAELDVFGKTVENMMESSILEDDAFAVSDLCTALKPLSISPRAGLPNSIHFANMAQVALLIDSTRTAEVLIERSLFIYLDSSVAPKHAEYNDPIRNVLKRARIGGNSNFALVNLSLNAQHEEANYDRGIHLVVNLGRWQEAVKHLALGKDPQYKELALATQAAADPTAKVAVAGRWSELGAAADSPARELARLLLKSVLAEPALSPETGTTAKAALEKLGPSPFTAVLIQAP